MIKRRTTVEFILILLSFFSSIYIYDNVSKPGFEMMWILPLTFMLCTHMLINKCYTIKNTLFFVAFTIIAFLRYVAGPALLVITDDYFGQILRSRPSIDALQTAAWLMSYELVVCTLVFVFFPFKPIDKFNREVPGQKTNDYILPKRTGIYILLTLSVIVLAILFPRSLQFFSFATFGMNMIDLSSLNVLEQGTIMLLICARFFLFIVIISYLKKQSDKFDGRNRTIDFLGIVITLVFGVIYYGGNRAQFIFIFACTVYVYLKLFPKNKSAIYTISAVMLMFVLTFMTDERGYYDYYSKYSGVEKFLFNASETIASYFGGITNVAVSIDMKAEFAHKIGVTQFLKDLTVPIVGINNLINFPDRVMTNELFNYQFFASTKNVTQILPSIGHGYFFFGFAGAPIIDIVQLLIVRKLYFIQEKTNRIELVYLFNVVILRFAIIFGQNISQQINGLSMQLMLPIVIFYLNEKISLRSKANNDKKY